MKKLLPALIPMVLALAMMAASPFAAAQGARGVYTIPQAGSSGTGSGSVTGVLATAPLHSDGSSTTPTVSINNTITPAGPIGSATQIPVITYDAHGMLTTVTTAAVSGMTPFATAATAAFGMAVFGGL